MQNSCLVILMTDHENHFVCACVCVCVYVYVPVCMRNSLVMVFKSLVKTKFFQYVTHNFFSFTLKNVKHETSDGREFRLRRKEKPLRFCKTVIIFKFMVLFVPLLIIHFNFSCGVIMLGGFYRKSVKGRQVYWTSNALFRYARLWSTVELIYLMILLSSSPRISSSSRWDVSCALQFVLLVDLTADRRLSISVLCTSFSDDAFLEVFFDVSYPTVGGSVWDTFAHDVLCPPESDDRNNLIYLLGPLG